MKTHVFRKLLCHSIIFSISLAIPAAALAQTLCTVFPLPATSGFSTPSPNGLSDLDTVNNVYYLAGGCSVYPLIFQKGYPALRGSEWTVNLPTLPFPGGMPGPISAPPLVLPPFPIANAANYADGQSAALTGNGAAPFSVRVGYTPIHLSTGLRFLATSWVWNGTTYTPNNLDPAAAYASSRAYNVSLRENGSLVAGGSAANVGTRGFTAEQPVYWNLANANGTTPGPVKPADPSGLAPLTTGRDAVVYAVSPRTDGGTTLTFAGSGTATLNSYVSTWATFWRVTPPAANNAPINLNGATGLPMPMKVNTGNPNAGGAAYAVTQDPNPPGADDIVVGTVQRFTPNGRFFTLVNQACVWMNVRGGAFTATLLSFSAAGNSKESIARGVAIVNGTITVVGDVRSNDDNKWHGFIATYDAGSSSWTVSRATANAFSPGWNIVGIKAINSQGVMIGTISPTRSGITQRAILFENGGPLDPPPAAPPNG